MKYETVNQYYNTTESRVGYMRVLGGTKHFGYYEPGDSMWNFTIALRKMEGQLVAALGRVNEADMVLDAGSGMGDVASFVAARTGASVEGIDLLDFNVAEANRRARQRGLSNALRFTEGDYSAIPFADNTFDAVYTMETLVHAPDHKKVLAEFLRVLKPGGRVVLFEYSRSRPEDTSHRADRAIREVNRLAAMPSFDIFYPGVLKADMQAAGFEVSSVRDITMNIMPMLQAFAALARVPYYVLSLFGKRRKMANAMSAVKFWKYRQYIRYEIYMATKPE